MDVDNTLPPPESKKSKRHEVPVDTLYNLPKVPRQIDTGKDATVMETEAPTPLPTGPLALKEPAAGGGSSCAMDYVGAERSIRSTYEALREERDRLLNEFGDFDNIPEYKVTPTFKTFFKIGEKDRHPYVPPQPSDSQFAKYYEDPGVYECQSQGAGGGTTADIEEIDEDLDTPSEPTTVQKIRAANSAMIDRILDGPEDTFEFKGIGKLPMNLSMLQDMLGSIISPTEEKNSEKIQSFHPVVQWNGSDGSDGTFEGNYQIDPELEAAAYVDGKAYNNVTEMPIVLVCCVYDFKGERPAHLFAIILFGGKIYSFGFGYKSSDWDKNLETIPLVMYNPDDIMDEPFFTGSGDTTDFRKVAVLNMFLLKKEHIDSLKAFVVNKNPKVRVKKHKYVPVLRQIRQPEDYSDKCIYVASTSEENNLLLYDRVKPGLAFNCAKALAKMIFPNEMYCWGNSLATTIRRQALGAEDIAQLMEQEDLYYTTLVEWKSKKTSITRLRSDAAKAKIEQDTLKNQMDRIKEAVKDLIQPHKFDWGFEVLEEFEKLYSASRSPLEIVRDVSEFLTKIQGAPEPLSGTLSTAAQGQAVAPTDLGGTKKRKTRKMLTRSKRKTKHNKQKTSKKRTKKQQKTR
jgi:hypothetical protein